MLQIELETAEVVGGEYLLNYGALKVILVEQILVGPRPSGGERVRRGVAGASQAGLVMPFCGQPRPLHHAALVCSFWAPGRGGAAGGAATAGLYTKCLSPVGLPVRRP